MTKVDLDALPGRRLVYLSSDIDFASVLTFDDQLARAHQTFFRERGRPDLGVPATPTWWRFGWLPGDLDMPGTRHNRPGDHPMSIGATVTRLRDADEELKSLFGHALTDDQLARLGRGVSGGRVVVKPDNRGSGVVIQAEGPRVHAETIIYSEPGAREVIISNASLFIDETGQGTGLQLLNRQVSEARQLGVDHLATYAARGSKMNGYYTWPRLGYDGSIENISQRDNPFGARRVSELMATPEGRTWWKTNGQGLDLAFDLTEGSPDVARWLAYNAEHPVVVDETHPGRSMSPPAGWWDVDPSSLPPDERDFPTATRAHTPQRGTRHNRPGDHPIKLIKGKAWTPAKTTKGALRAIANMVDSLQTDEDVSLELLNTVSQGFWDLKSLGYDLKRIGVRITRQEFAREAQKAIAMVRQSLPTSPHDILCIHPQGAAAISYAKAARLEETNFWASAVPRSFVYHEYGHYLHSVTIGAARFGDESFKQVWYDERATEKIQNEMSRYGMTNHAEFVAETFAAHVGGRQWSPEVLALYEAYGGPPLHPLDFTNDVGPGGVHE